MATALKRRIVAEARAQGLTVTADGNALIDLVLGLIKADANKAVDDLFNPFITAPAALWTLSGITKGSKEYKGWVSLFDLPWVAPVLRAVLTKARDKLKAFIAGLHM